MTLDEAIKHAEEVAEKNDKIADTFEETLKNKIACRECAKEHRQLAEWLKELKSLRENEEVKEVFKNCDTCKHESLPPDSYPCDRCCHRYINQYVYDDKREVNADEN